MSHVGFVQLLHELTAALSGASHHNAVWLHEVIHSEAFSQEFRVGNHVEWDLGVGCHSCCDLVGSAHRYRAFVHNDFVVRHHVSQLFRNTQDIAEVSGAILVWGCGKGKKDDLGMVHRRLEVRGEGQTSCFDVAMEQNVEVGFVNGDFTALHRGYLLFVDVHANHVVSCLCETRSRDETYISCSDNGNVHDDRIKWFVQSKFLKIHRCLVQTPGGAIRLFRFVKFGKVLQPPAVPWQV